MGKKDVKLCTVLDNMQAEMILNVLMDYGIPAYKVDLGSGGLMNLYGGNRLFGEEIYVAEENIEKAKEILEGMGV